MTVKLRTSRFAVDQFPNCGSDIVAPQASERGAQVRSARLRMSGLTGMKRAERRRAVTDEFDRNMSPKRGDGH